MSERYREVGVFTSLVGSAGLYVATESVFATMAAFSALILSNEFWRRAQNNWMVNGGRGDIRPDTVKEVQEQIDLHHGKQNE